MCTHIHIAFFFFIQGEHTIHVVFHLSSVTEHHTQEILPHHHIGPVAPDVVETDRVSVRHTPQDSDLDFVWDSDSLIPQPLQCQPHDLAHWPLLFDLTDFLFASHP